MGKKLLITTASIAILLGIAYQIFLRDAVALSLGLGRTYNKISDYPYKCRRIRSSLLESCEDMVMDHGERRLYAACASVSGRKGWSPALVSPLCAVDLLAGSESKADQSHRGHKFNVSARSLTDHISVLDLDHPGSDDMHGVHTLSLTGNYVPVLATGSNTPVIDVLGLEIEVLSKSRLWFWLINHRPPTDAAGNLLDATRYGVNSTIEVFEHTRGSKMLEHVKTIVSDAIHTPNSLIATGDGGILITNDHDSGTPGIVSTLPIHPTFLRKWQVKFIDPVAHLRPPQRRYLSAFLGAGSVAYCSLSTGKCHIASPSNHTFYMANGITRSPSHANTLFVASSARGMVSTFDVTVDKKLTLLGEVKIGMFIDNLSVDEKGDVYIAGIPDIVKFAKSMEKDEEEDVPSTVFKLRKDERSGAGSGFVVEKVLEDIEGEFLPGSTSALHDAQTGSYWMSGLGSGYITVCHPQ